MRILITGASGLLGRALMREFLSNDKFDVHGTALTRAEPNLAMLDLRNSDNLEALVSSLSPDIIIHAAAERRPDICENDQVLTHSLNVEATANIARAAKMVSSGIIYISTDYVFDGTTPPYATDSKTNPLNTYGQSKLEGEQRIWSIMPEACVLRVPVLYGKVEYATESGVTAMAEQIKSRRTLKLDNWSRRYPTLVDDVAVVCRQLVEQKQREPEFSGTFHWSHDEMLTKFDMCLRIAEFLGINDVEITADNAKPQGAARPHDTKLDCSVLESLGLGRRTAFNDGLSLVFNT